MGFRYIILSVAIITLALVLSQKNQKFELETQGFKIEGYRVGNALKGCLLFESIQKPQDDHDHDAKRLFINCN